jgi:peptidoglycan/LPS O-acetylase OafA/YrhL
MITENVQPKFKYRPDIDGLRAIAVLLVVFFHAFPNRIKSGFIGVDIFFVISGFLISTIIFEDISDNKFSYAQFYQRRIRRIFPSLCIVLLSCLIFGWIALLTVEYTHLGLHVAAGSVFSSNILLWSESGYFDIDSASKPLLHLWSLGIEEQFYLVWPCMLILMSGLKKRHRLLLLLIIAFSSFALNIGLLAKYPIATFFMPFTRFWELAIGSIVAALMFFYKHELNGINQSFKNLLIAEDPKEQEKMKHFIF